MVGDRTIILKLILEKQVSSCGPMFTR